MRKSPVLSASQSRKESSMSSYQGGCRRLGLCDNVQSSATMWAMKNHDINSRCSIETWHILAGGRSSKKPCASRMRKTTCSTSFTRYMIPATRHQQPATCRSCYCACRYPCCLATKWQDRQAHHFRVNVNYAKRRHVVIDDYSLIFVPASPLRVLRRSRRWRYLYGTPKRRH